MKNFALRVSGDIKIELTQKTSKKKILHFWFNTFFVYESAVLEGEGENAKLVYTLNKGEIDDAHKDKEHKMFSDDFKVQLAFYNESSESTEYNRPNDNHHRTYPAATPMLPVMRATATATTIACESSNSSNSEMHIICDQQATRTGTYENVIDTTTVTTTIKPYTNHHNNTIMTERRPTSLITLNDNNSAHKLQPQQQQQHRRSDMLLNSMTAASITTTITTSSSNCSNHQRQQHNQQLKLLQMKHNTNSSNNHYRNHTQVATAATKTMLKSINNQSNISNSSNSSINSHITSVSSSTSMASTSGGVIGGDGKHLQNTMVNDFNEKHEDDLDNENEDDEDDDDDDDDDEDDDADREDNEEDWESGESAVNKPLPTTTTNTTTTTPIRNNEKQLVTNTITTSTTNLITALNTTTTTTIPKSTKKLSDRSIKIRNKVQNQMQKNSSGSSTSSNNYFNEIGDIVHFYNDNGNKVHIDNNYDVDVDDDDDDNVVDGINNDDDDNNEIQQLNMDEAANATANNYSNNNCQCTTTETENGLEETASITTTKRSIATNSCTNNNNNSNKQLMSNLAARYKFMNLLTAKTSNKVMAPRHSYFKCKSLKTKQPQSSNTMLAQTEATTKNINCLTNDCYMLAGAAGGIDCVDVAVVPELRTRTTSVGNSGGCAGGVSSGLGKASKLKLKLGLSKTNSKLKWTQKFHWLQNYVRSADAAADLRKSFAQTTTTSNQRLNSTSSGNTAAANCNGIKTNISDDIKILENKATPTITRTRTPSQVLVGIENNSCTEDYYSSICDNQLSFNNSPCKSPRSLINKHQIKHDGLTLCTPHLLPNKVTMTTTATTTVDDALKIVVVAAKPANLEAIGFNVTTAPISAVAEATAAVAIGTCNITNGSGGSGSNSSSGYATASTLHSDSSVYSTPPTTVSEHKHNLSVDDSHHDDEELVDTTKISPFIFPNISAEITELAHVLKATNIDQTNTKTITTTTTTINNIETLFINNGNQQNIEHNEQA